MGRKATKGKEKKKRWKEETSRMNALLAKVDAANKQDNPFSALSAFHKYDRNGLNLTIECARVRNLDQETVDWAFELLKKNMQSFYEESDWGWRDHDKREEMTEEKAWYLIAKNEQRKPVAFIHFRFDVEQDEEVLYCYEIQLDKVVQGKGLGKFMMQILELLAYRNEMIKVMLTVLKNNKDGYNFFSKTMKYEIDETSPEASVFEDSYCYVIMSKKTQRKTKPAS